MLVTASKPHVFADVYPVVCRPVGQMPFDNEVTTPDMQKLTDFQAGVSILT